MRRSRHCKLVHAGAIYSKPIAQEIENLASKEKRAKWIAYGGWVLPALAVACGAPTIRYAHVVVTFTDGETSMELIQEDAMYLHLSYRDIKKTEVKYIASTVPLDVDNEFVRFENIYNECSGYIYKVVYRK